MNKILGVMIVMIGIILLMSCFDNTIIPLSHTIIIGVSGLVIVVVGVLTFIWNDKIEDHD